MAFVFDGFIEVVARVSSTCLVTVQRNRYSVPRHWAKRRVSVRQYPERLDIYADHAWVASHARLFGRDQVSYDWQHYIPLLDRKPGALRNGAPFLEMPTPLLSLQTEWPLPMRKSPVNRVLACRPQSGYYGSCCRPKQKIAISVLFVINCNPPAFRFIATWRALTLKPPRLTVR
jgi:hypothetical protein